MPVDIGERLVGDIRVVRPAGRLDGVTSLEFQEHLRQSVSGATTGVVVDFAAVEYISSAGLRALVAAARQRQDCRLAVAALQPIVQEIFRIARFQHVMPIFASVDEAVRALTAAGNA
jgi:anti-sigma B factor antagonist